MQVFESIAIALDMLRQHKLRAFLTMLGVIIGVMSVTTIVMVSIGFQSYIRDQFGKLGSDTMFVFYDQGRRQRGQSLGNIDKMTMDDLEYLMQRVQSLEIGSGMITVPTKEVRFNDQYYTGPQVYGGDENFQELNRFTLIRGRKLTKGDLDGTANVCLVGEDVSKRLFLDRNPIGERVILSGLSVEIIGVIKKEDFMGDSTARMVLLPITTVQKKWTGGNRIDFMMLRPKPGTKISSAMDNVWQALMKRSNNRAVYRLDSRESIASTLNGVLGAATMILGAIAALSLLVGGVGIMNIMLVSVTERTREIGLRKAIGAPSYSILIQFVVESGTISLVGGLIGMGIAWTIGSLVTFVTAAKEWPQAGGLATPFPLSAALIAAAFSAIIGMVFGLYPALSASKLDPIVALRKD